MKTFRKVAFTLAEGATHIDMSDNISDNVTNIVEGATHVDIYDNIRKCAFTLAEVLITLGIIGVVAALTLPPLIQHHNKVVWVNQLKKSVNTLENGFKMAMAEDGVDKLMDTSLWQNVDTNCARDLYAGNTPNCQDFYNNLKKYFNITYNNDAEVINYLPLNKGASLNVLSYVSQTMTMPITFEDGTQINFSHMSVGDQAVCGVLAPVCAVARIFIDINGRKGPNTFGRDVFLFGVAEQGQVLPIGSRALGMTWCCNGALTCTLDYNCLERIPVSNNFWDSNNVSGCSSEGNGLYCAARIIENGWKMDY